MKRIGFWWRALAVAMDVIIVSMINAVVVAILQMNVSTDHAMATATVIINLCMVSFMLLYSMLEPVFAATPGKVLFGLAIGNANGTRADKSTLWLRWSSKYLPLLLMSLWLITRNGGFYVLAGMANSVVAIGCLMALGEMKRTWVDQWAGTAVFKKRDLIPVPTFPAPARGVAPPT